MISRMLRRGMSTISGSSSISGTTSKAKKGRVNFEEELKSKIKLTGPMSLSQFMQEVLGNPSKGYYTTKEKVLGAPGDFVTSPEISQMFGECIGIWIVHEWKKMGKVQPLQLVELGPGHGTLMQDILRTVQKLTPEELKHFNVHLVETSPNLSKVQEARLCGYSHSKQDGVALSKQGVPVKWHSRVGEIPKGFTFFIANEFFDALPIHKFMRDTTSKNWQEILVDLSPNDNKLTLVKSKHKTLANQYIDDTFDHLQDSLEISPKSAIVMETISERIVENGGAALIADYGYDSDQKDRDTFRAYKNHKQVDPLQDVGQCDLTADVDFDYLKKATGEHTLTYGPVSQSQFLSQLGIKVRCNLLKDHNPKIADELESSLDMLINPEKMGARFKFFCVFPKTMETIHAKFPPAGFYNK